MATDNKGDAKKCVLACNLKPAALQPRLLPERVGSVNLEPYDQSSNPEREERLLARRRRDWELMARVAIGNSEALREIWDQYVRHLSSYLYQKGIQDADEIAVILQKVRDKVERFAGKYDRNISTVGTWFALITDNVIYQRRMVAVQVRDQTLMARVAQGDREAFEEIEKHYQYYWSRRLVDRRILDAGLAHDILQEVRFQVVRFADQYDPNTGTVRKWLDQFLDSAIQRFGMTRVSSSKDAGEG
jgi:hypothetical protein